MKRMLNQTVVIGLLLGVVVSGCASYSGNNVDAPLQSNRQDTTAGTNNNYKTRSTTDRSNGVIGHNNSHLSASQTMSKRIANMPGVKSATVIMTDHSAYVGVMLGSAVNPGVRAQNTGALDDTMKQRIANVIRRNNAAIENVYVSENADFVKRMDNYMNEINQGRPVSGLMKEFNTMVERVFPSKK